MKYILFLILITTLLNAKPSDDLMITWDNTIYKLLNAKEDKIMSSVKDIRYISEEKQDTIRKKAKNIIAKIKKSRVVFDKKDLKHGNSIYGNLFHYGNNESMFTVFDTNRVTRYFLIGDKIWRVLITIEKEQLKKNYDLKSFIAFFTKKHGEPYLIEYDKFKREEHIPVKAYFKDEKTLLELSYSSIYNSFILVYSSISKMKELKEQGFKVLKRDEIKFGTDNDDLSEYNELEYESNYTSNDDDEETKDVFNEIDKDFEKEKKDSKKRKKERKKNEKKSITGK